MWLICEFPALNGHNEVAFLQPCVVDAIPAVLRTFQRLTSRYSFVEIRAGAIKLLLVVIFFVMNQ